MHTTISVAYAPPIATVTIAGELDPVSRGRLAWRLIDLNSLDCRTVRLDFGAVTHIDAACLRLIDDARRRVAGRGAMFELTAVSSYVGLVATLAGFHALSAPGRTGPVSKAADACSGGRMSGTAVPDQAAAS